VSIASGVASGETYIRAFATNNAHAVGISKLLSLRCLDAGTQFDRWSTLRGTFVVQQVERFKIALLKVLAWGHWTPGLELLAYSCRITRTPNLTSPNSISALRPEHT
jgi:hypothetical protein